MAEISDMYWAMNIKMDYAQNLRKDPVKAKKRTFTKSIQGAATELTLPL